MMEDFVNDFMLDIGCIEMYWLLGGNGVCLDVGNIYFGVIVMFYFDLLFVKVCVVVWNFKVVVYKMWCVLVEFDICGVKMNILFMLNVIDNLMF